VSHVKYLSRAFLIVAHHSCRSRQLARLSCYFSSKKISLVRQTPILLLRHYDDIGNLSSWKLIFSVLKFPQKSSFHTPMQSQTSSPSHRQNSSSFSSVSQAQEKHSSAIVSSLKSLRPWTLPHVPSVSTSTAKNTTTENTQLAMHNINQSTKKSFRFSNGT
jgi:hypothetical protein